MTPCARGCIRPITRNYLGGVSIHNYPTMRGFRSHDAVAIPIPQAVQRDFNDAIDQTPIVTRPPSFGLYDNLHGVGGLFVAAEWAILVGSGDMFAITRAVLATNASSLINSFWVANRRRPTPQELMNFGWGVSTRRCIAHEIGHAMDAAGYRTNPYASDPEASADYWAGWIEGRLGRDRTLGELFFSSIGCVGPTCTHPEPRVRAEAYREGYFTSSRSVATR